MMVNSCICSQIWVREEVQKSVRNAEKHTKAIQAEAGKGTAATSTHDEIGASDTALIQNPQGDVPPMSLYLVAICHHEQLVLRNYYWSSQYSSGSPDLP